MVFHSVRCLFTIIVVSTTFLTSHNTVDGASGRGLYAACADINICAGACWNYDNGDGSTWRTHGASGIGEREESILVALPLGCRRSVTRWWTMDD